MPPFAHIARSLLLAGALAASAATDAEAQVFRRRNRDTTRRQLDLDTRETLHHRGTERTYIIRVPERVRRSDRPVPLVIALHGGGGNADNAERMTGLTPKAESEGFIVVYPDGSARGNTPIRTWNARHCCGYAMNNHVDDVGFISALIDEVSTTYRIDAKRVYATGMSNGAMMAHRLGIELSDRIAAIAPVVGALFGDERRPSAPVSAIIINGRVDRMIPYDGGPPTGSFSRAWDGRPTVPAIDQATFWANANHCRRSPRRTATDDVVTLSHDCPAPSGVVFHTLEDGGHAWPGGRAGSRRADAPSRAMKATDVIWDFFAAHPKR